MTSTTVTSATPNGVLAGMVAYPTDSAEVGVLDNGLGVPIGLFATDSSQASYENTPAIASGKLTVLQAGGLYLVEYYETYMEDGVTEITYVAGDLLYASRNGLLTSDNTTSTIAFAVVTKTPTAHDARLGVQLT
ncbi:MAG: hypothetical protein WC783_01000 [Candidatus Paceibacterota bacterium]